jgi:hypothetical protein
VNTPRCSSWKADQLSVDDRPSSSERRSPDRVVGGQLRDMMPWIKNKLVDQSKN